MFIFTLIVYLIGVTIFSVFGVIIVYHLVHYSFLGDATKVMIGLFASIAIAIIAFSGIHFFTTNWSELNLVPVAPQEEEGELDKPIFRIE
ncbi:hypothetical protein ACFL2D_00670 [Patescibacteria group bacterium]